MAEVKIDFTAKDKATRVIEEMAAELSKLRGQVDKLKKSSDQTKAFSQSWTELKSKVDLAIGGVQSFIRTAQQVYSATVGAWSSYVEEIDKVSQKTGIAADEISRVLQVGDDFRVEMGTMQTAMDMAVQNGFVPTIDNLAKLSDELKAIQDPIERSNRAQAIFGRQWKEIYPFLDRGGQAIRDAAAGIADGLVVTEAAIETNRKYQKSLDDLGDSWTALKNVVVIEAMPGIAGSLEVFARNIEALGKGESLFKILASNQRMYANLEVQMSKKTQDANKYLLDQWKISQGVAKSQTDVSTGFTLAGDSVTAYSSTMEHVAEVIRKSPMNGDEYSAALRENAKEMEDATIALDNARGVLASAEQSWREGIAGGFEQKLDEAKPWEVTDEEKNAFRAAIDESYGTGLVAAENLRLATEKIWEDFKETKDIDAAKQALKELETAFMPLDESVKKSMDLVDELQGKLNDIAHVYTAIVRVRYEDEGGPLPPDPPDPPDPDDDDDDGPVMMQTSTTNGGNNYNLTVMTSQSTAVITHSFAILKALAGV